MLAQRASGPHCGTSHPRLFVYDLPPSYHQCIDLKHLADASGFPRLLQNGSLTQPPLRQTGGYALGSVFLSRALNYSCRTWDAADADLFFRLCPFCRKLSFVQMRAGNRTAVGLRSIRG